MKMPAVEKHEWIEALISGLHKQGQGLLHVQKTTELCCLGVLCELSKERCHLTITTNETGGVEYNDDGHGLCRVLRDRYQTPHHAGFLVPIERLTSEELKGQNQVTLNGMTGVWISDLNDSGVKFPRIAELVDLCVEAV